MNSVPSIFVRMSPSKLNQFQSKQLFGNETNQYAITNNVIKTSKEESKIKSPFQPHCNFLTERLENTRENSKLNSANAKQINLNVELQFQSQNSNRQENQITRKTKDINYNFKEYAILSNNVLNSEENHKESKKSGILSKEVKDSKRHNLNLHKIDNNHYNDKTKKITKQQSKNRDLLNNKSSKIKPKKNDIELKNSLKEFLNDINKQDEYTNNLISQISENISTWKSKFSQKYSPVKNTILFSNWNILQKYQTNNSQHLNKNQSQKRIFDSQHKLKRGRNSDNKNQFIHLYEDKKERPSRLLKSTQKLKEERNLMECSFSPTINSSSQISSKYNRNDQIQV